MKFYFILTILFVFFSCMAIDCKAQLSSDIQRAESLFSPPPKTSYSEFAKDSKNEIESTFSIMFVIYKDFISSQDIESCVFQPTCSVYAIECIHHEKSKFTAFLKISDRLMRCHPLISKNSYKTDKETGKYSDTIEN